VSAGAKARRQRPKPPKATGTFTHCKATGKRRYVTSDDATLAATQIRNAEPVRTYLCPDCGGWHLTRQVRRAR
jgi:uncharacterized protein YlaI